MQCTMRASCTAGAPESDAANGGGGRVTGAISLRFEKRHGERLKQLGYRRHPQGSGWVRPVKRAWFPRFHLFTATDWTAKQLTFDLHLDHERENPDSAAPTASSGSAEVTAEMARILREFSG